MRSLSIWQVHASSQGLWVVHLPVYGWVQRGVGFFKVMINKWFTGMSDYHQNQKKMYACFVHAPFLSVGSNTEVHRWEHCARVLPGICFAICGQSISLPAYCFTSLLRRSFSRIVHFWLVLVFRFSYICVEFLLLVRFRIRFGRNCPWISMQMIALVVFLFKCRHTSTPLNPSKNIRWNQKFNWFLSTMIRK